MMGVSVLLNFSLTIKNAIYVKEFVLDKSEEEIDLNYQIFSKSIHLNHIILEASQLIVIIICSIFILPLVILLVV